MENKRKTTKIGDIYFSLLNILGHIITMNFFRLELVIRWEKNRRIQLRGSSRHGKG
jgi:hypothetical protein